MIILHGQTPSHKNSKQMFRSSRTGKMFPANNNKYLAWKNSAIVDANLSKEKYSDSRLKLCMSVRFFVKDKRRRDLDNMVASVQDVLVEAGIIQDDNAFCLSTIFAHLQGIDKENPRAEISFLVANDLESVAFKVGEF